MPIVALALSALLPSPQFRGAIHLNTQDEYENLTWLDDRPKPTWADITAKDAELQAAAIANPPKTILQRVEAVEALIAIIKAKVGA